MSRRYRLNPLLRYKNSKAGKVPIRTIHVPDSAEENDCRALRANQSGEEFNLAVNFTPDEETLLNKEIMTSPAEVTVYTQPAYLIYRELSSDDAAEPTLEPIPEKDIVRLESNANYCYVYTRDNERVLMAMGLKWVVQHMNNFVRIHRSHAINSEYISMYLLPRRSEDNGERYMLLTTGERVPWSRRLLKETRRVHKDLFRKPKKTSKKEKNNPT